MEAWLHGLLATLALPRFGPKACLAGWLRLPFWPCVLYMALGKFARYLTMTTALLWVFPGRFTP
jgi:membrane protein YqaA with SNARE-associated domain